MPRIDFPALANPLSEADPCGPDLDLAGDEDYLNFVTIAEGLLPSEFFQDGAPVDVTAIDVEAECRQIFPLIQRSRDIRLLSLLARFLILDRDLAGFVGSLEAIAQLLSEYWDKVHPGADGVQLALRTAAIATLDQPTVFLPLQYVPLCEDRRIGVVTLRAILYAEGKANPREGEAVHALPALVQALRDSPSEYSAARDLIKRLATALTRIASIYAEHCGLDKAPRLDKLAQTVADLSVFLDKVAGQEAKKDQGSHDAADALGISGVIRNASGVNLALKAVIDYFTRNEPSSPALPLVVQARDLQGKTFVEVVQILLPNQAQNAAYAIGNQKSFALPLERLAALMPVIEDYGREDERADPVPSEPKPTDDFFASPPETDTESSTIAAESEPGCSSPLEPTHEIPKDTPNMPPVHSQPASPGDGRLIFTVAKRQEAISLLNEVAQYLRLAEPSSPIPLLIDRAKELANRDFLSILAAVLPEEAFR